MFAAIEVAHAKKFIENWDEGTLIVI